MPGKIVVYSRKDPAGVNIAKKLSEKGIKAKPFPESILHLRGMDAKPDICVVASRHSSESGIPVLTTHSPGNFGDAEHGGNPGELGFAPAKYLRQALDELRDLQEKKNLDYEVCFEATHHGPTSLGFPVMFVEVGSGQPQWSDMEACSAAAEAIRRIMSSEPKELPTAVGFGGGHYCRKFTQIEDWALGHICPKHSLEKLDEGMLEQMIEKTRPKPQAALVEKKGLGAEKQKVMALLEGSGLEVVRI